MLNDLKFVQGAVARKDYVPELTHFHIGGGRIYGFNGILGISTPTDLAVEATPKAASFVKAIEKLPEDEEVALNLTAAGRLSVRAGNFRAYVECHDDATGVVKIEPKGNYVDLAPGLLPVLKKIAPFMGIDATRPWAMGVMFRGQSAYATNNIVLVEHWLPLVFPDQMILPSSAIKEMIRVGEDPVGIQIEERAVTFHYESGAWLRTALIFGDWPDLSKVLDVETNCIPFPEGFFEGARRLDAFTSKENHVYFRGGVIATSQHEGDGALVELDDFGGDGCFFLEQLLKLEGVAESLDFSAWPRPCVFFGDMLRGAIMGMRL